MQADVKIKLLPQCHVEGTYAFADGRGEGSLNAHKVLPEASMVSAGSQVPNAL